MDLSKIRAFNEASTLLKSTSRLPLTLIASYYIKTWTRDIIVGFLLINDPLKREICIRSTKGGSELQKQGPSSTNTKIYKITELFAESLSVMQADL